MTTIAWDGKTLAADRGCITGLLANVEDKIWKIKVMRSHWTLTGIQPGSPAYVVGAGHSFQIKRYARWLERADDDDLPGVDESESLIVTKRAVLHIDGAGLGIPVLRRPIALGSGGEVALGALLAGATARRAVDLVAKNVAPSSAFGGIQVVERAWL